MRDYIFLGFGLLVGSLCGHPAGIMFGYAIGCAIVFVVTKVAKNKTTMNPCLAPKRQIAVAVVKSSTGLNQRIELLTVADLVHLFAISMGYKPDIAFAFGVISRSVPDVQAGECDVNSETAQKSIRIAEIISTCRGTGILPDDPTQLDAIRIATAHVHSIEQAYSELCEKIPGLPDTFSQQYNDWCNRQDKKEQKRNNPPVVRRLVNCLIRNRHEQAKHS